MTSTTNIRTLAWYPMDALLEEALQQGLVGQWTMLWATIDGTAEKALDTCHYPEEHRAQILKNMEWIDQLVKDIQTVEKRLGSKFREDVTYKQLVWTFRILALMQDFVDDEDPTFREIAARYADEL